MSTDLIDFLRDRTNLIESSDFDRLFYIAERQLSTNDYFEFIQLLKDSDIDPIPYMTYIPYSYYQGENMTEIAIPPSIKEILMDAFKDCFWLRKIHLPGTVEYIHIKTFETNNNLKVVTFDGNRDQWRMVSVSKIYNDPLFKCGVICNDGKVEYYKEDQKDWEIIEW